MVDTYGVKRLLCAVIEQAVIDRRTAVSRGLIDKEGIPTQPLNSKQTELCCGLNYFFEGRGLDFISTTCGFDLPVDKIRRKSREEFGKGYDGKGDDR